MKIIRDMNLRSAQCHRTKEERVAGMGVERGEGSVDGGGVGELDKASRGRT